MRRVTKAVIPTAGLGTRFLPATKSVPKELLPIVDKPILLYIIEEIVKAGIEDIILVTSRGKTAIEDFFDRSYELEEKLEKQGKSAFLKDLIWVRERANFISIRQPEARGLGHAVFCSRPIVGDHPFAVLLGDEIMIGQPTVTQTLTQTFSEHGFSTIAIMEVPQADVVKYGIADVKPLKGNLYTVRSVVEKPPVDKAPSRWALPGRYVFEPLIFELLKNTKPGVGGEIQLTDAIQVLATRERLLASTFSCRRYDAGDKLGFLQANVELGLQHGQLGTSFRAYLKELARTLE